MHVPDVRVKAQALAVGQLLLAAMFHTHALSCLVCALHNGITQEQSTNNEKKKKQQVFSDVLFRSSFIPTRLLYFIYSFIYSSRPESIAYSVLVKQRRWHDTVRLLPLRMRMRCQSRLW